MLAELEIPVAIVVAGLVIGLVAISRFRLSSPSASDERTILVSEAPAETDKFAIANNADGSFLVFITDRMGPDDGAGFAQVSVENGKLGVDHVFSAEINRTTERDFRNVAKSEGLTVVEAEHNGIQYLRVETDSPGRLIRRVLRRVNRLRHSESIKIFSNVTASGKLQG